MITCDLIGRLGNQMFQIAATIAAAQRAGAKYGFPKKAIGSYTGEVYFHHLPAANSCAYPVYKEKSHDYSPIPIRDNLKLHGYWQSAKYFDDYRGKIMESFQMPPIVSDYDCSLHIRLGDYVQFKDKHPPVTLEYIDKALDYMHHEHNTLSVLVFSDDIDSATAMIKKTDWYGTGMQFVFCTETDPKISMRMMAGCKHNIIANSSFSWWGAWLNENPNKIVIAPKVWFGPGNKNLSDRDIVPINWTRL